MKLYATIILAVWAQVNTSKTQQTEYLELMQRGRAEYRDGHYSASQQLFIDALSKVQESDDRERAATLADLGDVYASQEEWTKAERAYSECLSIYKRLSDNGGTALMLHNVGMLDSLQGHDEVAQRLLQEALKLIKSIPEADPAFMAQVLNGIGIIHYRLGNNGKAEKFFEQVMQITSAPGVRFDSARTLNNLGDVYLAQRKLKKAEDTFKRVLEMKEAEVGQSHPDLVLTLTALGVLYSETKRYTAAEEQYRRALAILEPHASDFEPAIARLLHSLSITYARAGRKSESNMALAEAAAIARKNLHKGEMASIVEDYSVVLKSQGKTSEAEELRVQAKRARSAAGLVIPARSFS